MADTNTPTKLPDFSTSTAMALMWEAAADNLQTHELEWFASGAAEQLNREISALTDVLSGVGCLVLNDEDVGSFQTAKSASNLLFNLSSQVSAISGLASIAADASYRVRLALKGQP